MGLYIFHCAYVCWNWGVWCSGGDEVNSFVRQTDAVLRMHVGLGAWTLIAHAMLVTFIIGTAIGLVRWNLLSHSMQGRLMFTTLPIISMYLAAGVAGVESGETQKNSCKRDHRRHRIHCSVHRFRTLLPPLISLPRRSPNRNYHLISNRFGRGLRRVLSWSATKLNRRNESRQTIRSSSRCIGVLSRR